MSESNGSGLQAELEQIRRHFVDSLPAQIQHLETELRALPSESGEARDSALRQALVTAHSLAGTAGTFGYPAVGSAAKMLEFSLRDELEEGGDLPGMTRRHLSHLESLVFQTSSAIEGSVKPLAFDAAPARAYAKAGAIVLIEDDPALSGRLTSYLHHFGYEVRCFDCEQAFLLAAPTLEPPSALLIDNALPEGALAGIRAAIKRPESMADTPILFMSANDSQEARIGALRAGGRGYLLKPVEPALVLDALENVIEDASGRPIRVLILDDEPAMVAHHSAVLRAAGFDTVDLTDPAELLATMRDQQPDIVLLDLYMPNHSGDELAAMIHQIPTFAGIPVLFVSAEHSLDAQQAAMLCGGDDFLAKPVPAERLVSAVRYRATRHRQLRDLMKHDSLTGLLNHASIKEQLASEMHRIDRHGGSLAVAMIDIDRFKHINDTFGHASGDRILRELAMLLRRRLRSSDLSGRYGGEEFVVLLPNTGGSDAMDLLNAIREDFAEITHFLGDQAVQVTFSAGVATRPEQLAPESILIAADAALYEAKKAGRNQVRFARDVL